MSLFRAVILSLTILTAAVIILLINKREEAQLFTADMDASYMRGIDIIHHEGEKLLWTASVDESLLSADSTDTTLRGVTVRYNEGGLTLRSESGYYNFNTGELRFTGAVSGESEEFSFTSGRMVYLPEESLLIASDGLRIIGGKYNISGESGSIRNSHILEVKGNVRAVFH